jgi:hypothetical protein
LRQPLPEHWTGPMCNWTPAKHFLQPSECGEHLVILQELRPACRALEGGPGLGQLVPSVGNATQIPRAPIRCSSRGRQVISKASLGEGECFCQPCLSLGGVPASSTPSLEARISWAPGTASVPSTPSQATVNTLETSRCESWHQALCWGKPFLSSRLVTTSLCQEGVPCGPPSRSTESYWASPVTPAA